MELNLKKTPVDSLIRLTLTTGEIVEGTYQEIDQSNPDTPQIIVLVKNIYRGIRFDEVAEFDRPQTADSEISASHEWKDDKITGDNTEQPQKKKRKDAREKTMLPAQGKQEQALARPELNDDPLGTVYTGEISAFYVQFASDPNTQNPVHHGGPDQDFESTRANKGLSKSNQRGFGFITEMSTGKIFYFRTSKILDKSLKNSLWGSNLHQIVRFSKLSDPSPQQKYPSAQILEQIKDEASASTIDNRDIIYKIAISAERDHNNEFAKSQYLRVIESDPTANEITLLSVWRRVSLLGRKKPQEALAFLEEYIDLFDPSSDIKLYKKIILLKVDFLARTDQYDKAAEVLNRFLNNPDILLGDKKRKKYIRVLNGYLKKEKNFGTCQELKDQTNKEGGQAPQSKINSAKEDYEKQISPGNGMLQEKEEQVKTDFVRFIFPSLERFFSLIVSQYKNEGISPALRESFDQLSSLDKLEKREQKRVIRDLFEKIQKERSDLFDKNDIFANADVDNFCYISESFSKTVLQYDLFRLKSLNRIESLNFSMSKGIMKSQFFQVSVLLRQAMSLYLPSSKKSSDYARAMCMMSFFAAKGHSITRTRRIFLFFSLTFLDLDEKGFSAIWDVVPQERERNIVQKICSVPGLPSRILAEMDRLLFYCVPVDDTLKMAMQQRLQDFCDLLQENCKNKKLVAPAIRTDFADRFRAIFEQYPSFLKSGTGLTELIGIIKQAPNWNSPLDCSSELDLLKKKFTDYAECMSYSKKQQNRASYKELLNIFRRKYFEKNTSILIAVYVYPLLVRLQTEINEDFDRLSNTPPDLQLDHSAGNSYRLEENQLKLLLILRSDNPLSPPISNIALYRYSDGEEGLANAELIETDLPGGKEVNVLFPLEPTLEEMKEKSFLVNLGVGYNQAGKTYVLPHPLEISVLIAENEFVPIENIYSDFEGGNPVEPNLFVGREEVVAEIVEHFARHPLGQCYLLHGQKRSGKTSIMHNISEKLKKENCVYIYFTQDTILDEKLFQRFAGKMLYALHRQNLEINVDESLLREDPRLTLEEVGVQIEKSGKRWIIAIDEFTYLYDNLNPETKPFVEVFLRELKALLQEKVFSILIVAQDIIDQLIECFPNELAISKRRRITYLSREATEQLASGAILLPDRSSRYTPKALQMVFQLTYGHPYYLQKFCARLVKYLNKNRFQSITEKEIQIVADSMVCGLDSLEQGDWDGLYDLPRYQTIQSGTPKEIPPVLFAIARKNVNSLWCPLADLKDVPHSKDDLDSLLKKGTIEISQDSKVHILVELFVRWLNCHNLDDLSSKSFATDSNMTTEIEEKDKSKGTILPTKNDFLCYSEPVTEQSFWGREKQLKELMERCRRGKTTAIVGLPRIGKTSLALEAIRQLKEEGFFCVKMSLEGIRSRKEFYRNLISSINREIIDQEDLCFPNNESEMGEESKNAFLCFLDKHIKQKKPVLLLDEFDTIRDKEWKGDPRQCIADIRTYSQDERCTMILVQRRTLRMLEERTQNSTLAQAIETIYLRPLEKDVACRIMETSEKPLNDAMKDYIWDITCGHPYLIATALHHYNHPKEEKNDDTGLSLKREINMDFRAYYYQLGTMFQEFGFYDKFCYLAIFRRSVLRSVILDEIYRYGLWLPNKSDFRDGHVFSEHYLEYLSSEEEAYPISDLLKGTEKRFRKFIDFELTEKKGADWFEKVPENYLSAKDKEDILSRLETHRRNQGDPSWGCPIDCTYPANLASFLDCFWTSVFQPILGDNKRKFTEKLRSIQQARNIDGHCNEMSVDFRKKIIQDCFDLLDYLDKANVDENGVPKGPSQQALHY